MKILISNMSDKPVYAQIEEQIREQILSGEIEEGSRLPSIRALAREVGVSVITTTRAYSDLERDGFITSMQGKGSIVLSRDNEYLREQYLKRIEAGLETAITTAGLIGMEKEGLQAMLDSLWEEAAAAARGRDNADETSIS